MGAKRLENLRTAFADKLRAYCDATGTYSQIARDLGINRQQFARYLNGTTMPRDGVVKKIAEYFGIEPSELLTETSNIQIYPEHKIGDAANWALMGWASQIVAEPISIGELADGLYMQYKQSFTQPNKVVCMLARISRDALGAVRWKRRYSSKVLPSLPGAHPSDVSHGVFTKVLGTLVLLDIDGIAGDLVFSSFRPSSVFSMSDSVKTGVVMTHGRSGNAGPISGIHVIEKIPSNQSPLGWARLQGFKSVEDLPEHIQYHFAVPAHLPRTAVASV